MELRSCQLCLDCDTGIVNNITQSDIASEFCIKGNELLITEYFGILSCQTSKYVPTYLFNKTQTFYHNHEPTDYEYGLWAKAPDEALSYQFTLQYKNERPYTVQRTHGTTANTSFSYWIAWKRFCKCDNPDIYRVINTVIPFEEQKPSISTSGDYVFTIFIPRGPMIDSAHANWSKYTSNTKIYENLLIAPPQPK